MNKGAFEVVKSFESFAKIYGFGIRLDEEGGTSERAKFKARKCSSMPTSSSSRSLAALKAPPVEKENKKRSVPQVTPCPLSNPGREGGVRKRLVSFFRAFWWPEPSPLDRRACRMDAGSSASAHASCRKAFSYIL